MTEINLQSAYKQLKPTERLFVDAYLVDLENDAVAAGKRVKEFMSSGGSRTRSAKYIADRMMQKPLVQAAIAERIDQMSEALNINAAKVLAEVTNIAMASIGNYMRVDGMGMPVFDLTTATPEQLAAVKKIKITESVSQNGGTFEFELHPKMQALDMLMKFFGLYGEDNMQKVVPANTAAQQPKISQQQTVSQAAELYARTLRGHAV